MVKPRVLTLLLKMPPHSAELTSLRPGSTTKNRIIGFQPRQRQDRQRHGLICTCTICAVGNKVLGFMQML